MMQVNVYTRSKVVKLELNGKTIAEQTVADGSITATFNIEYQQGTLVAKAFDDGKETGASILSTAGKPAAIRLIADRRIIKADPNDLSFVSVEIINDNGNIVPSVDGLEISFQLTGHASIAGVGNGDPEDMSSFQQNHKKIYEGKALAIVRPIGTKGIVTLTATAVGLTPGSVQIEIK
jgi:beta-galactosidase